MNEKNPVEFGGEINILIYSNTNPNRSYREIASPFKTCKVAADAT